ncbi:MAG: hypothetical protein PHG41_07385, partial [Actinomycetota bacterium]|nr:hypothetical protein [Actinomycetota bacterium]
RDDALLFGESQSCIVVSLPRKNLPLLEDIALKYKAPIQILGEVGGDSLRFGNLVDLKIDKIIKSWEKYFNNV